MARREGSDEVGGPTLDLSHRLSACREGQMDGIAKAMECGMRFGRKSLLIPETVKDIRALQEAGATVPEIIRRTGLSKASVYRALGRELINAYPNENGSEFGEGTVVGRECAGEVIRPLGRRGACYIRLGAGIRGECQCAL
jgi:hypothetical protein